jgi:hypothetical protein
MRSVPEELQTEPLNCKATPSIFAMLTESLSCQHSSFGYFTVSGLLQNKHLSMLLLLRMHFRCLIESLFKEESPSRTTTIRWNKSPSHWILSDFIAIDVRLFLVSQLLYPNLLDLSVSERVFPRVKTMENLLRVIRQQPRLSKDASTTLVDLGGVVHANATQEEIDVLLRGTLSQESYVRASCLQAIQVRVD